MTNYIAYKYRLKPTKEQELTFRAWGGSCRWIWNIFLSKIKDQYALNKTFPSYENMANELPDLKKQEETSWLVNPHSQTLQQRLKDLRKAIESVYKSGFGFPKYKSKRHQSDSFRIPQGAKFSKKSICIPKIGWVNWIRHRPLTGKFKELTIKQEGQHWYAICVCEITPCSPITECHIDEVLGIDLGLESLLVCSDGSTYENPKWLRSKEKLLKRRSRQLSHKRKGSNNRNKARQKLAVLHRKIRNIRNDYLHKISTSIIKKWNVIGLEDLNIKALAKTRLAKSIHDVGWNLFRQMLEYKAHRQGKEVVYIDRFYPSTQTCFCCGSKRKIPPSERIYTCDSCGSSMSRDLNAALNIKAQAIYRAGTARIYACLDNVSQGETLSAQQELRLRSSCKGDTSGGEIDNRNINHDRLCVVEAGIISVTGQEANGLSCW